MTKTLRNKTLTITTITVLATFLMIFAIVDDAQANGTEEFECEEVVGSFFPPPATPPFVFSSASGECSELGEVSIASITTLVGPAFAPNCINLTTPIGLDSFAISEDGHVTFSMLLEQCFLDSTMTALPGPPTSFCSGPAATTAFFSTVTSSYMITGGLIDGKVVTGGTGTSTSTVDHCDPSAPFGNSFVSTLTGTIIISDDDDD